MTLLSLESGVRQELWPEERHIGLPMLLPGGEEGRLLRFEHPDNSSEWTYALEFRGSREQEKPASTAGRPSLRVVRLPGLCSLGQQPEGGTTMYGTVAKTRVKPENREKLSEVVARHTVTTVPGYVAAYTLFENDSDTAWLFAVFEDRDSYDRNADDPAQNERYVEYRALMEADPEWHDGEIRTS
jgi:quinol monooxygenase YgiN